MNGLEKFMLQLKAGDLQLATGSIGDYITANRTVVGVKKY